jgi:hypothetical protein
MCVLVFLSVFMLPSPHCHVARALHQWGHKGVRVATGQIAAAVFEKAPPHFYYLGRLQQCAREFHYI